MGFLPFDSGMTCPHDPNHPVDRRSFLAAASAAPPPRGLRLAAPRLPPRTDPSAASPSACRATPSASSTSNRRSSGSKELGLKHVEFYQKHIPPDSTPGADQGHPRSCARSTTSRRSPSACRGFTKNHDANKKLFEFGKALGVKYLSADPTPDSFDSLDKLCDEYKIAIAIHPHGPQGRTSGTAGSRPRSS